MKGRLFRAADKHFKMACATYDEERNLWRRMAPARRKAVIDEILKRRQVHTTKGRALHARGVSMRRVADRYCTAAAKAPDAVYDRTHGYRSRATYEEGLRRLAARKGA